METFQTFKRTDTIPHKIEIRLLAFIYFILRQAAGSKIKYKFLLNSTIVRAQAAALHKLKMNIFTALRLLRISNKSETSTLLERQTCEQHFKQRYRKSRNLFCRNIQRNIHFLPSFTNRGHDSKQQLLKALFVQLQLLQQLINSLTGRDVLHISLAL
ncbi:hypothetical protein D3C76_978660 [compost metagenome]